MENENEFCEKNLAYDILSRYQGLFKKPAPRLVEAEPTYKPYLNYLIECIFSKKEANPDKIAEIYGDYDLVIEDERNNDEELANAITSQLKKQGN